MELRNSGIVGAGGKCLSWMQKVSLSMCGKAMKVAVAILLCEVLAVVPPCVGGKVIGSARMTSVSSSLRGD